MKVILLSVSYIMPLPLPLLLLPLLLLLMVLLLQCFCEILGVNICRHITTTALHRHKDYRCVCVLTLARTLMPVSCPSALVVEDKILWSSGLFLSKRLLALVVEIFSRGCLQKFKTPLHLSHVMRRFCNSALCLVFSSVPWYDHITRILTVISRSAEG